MKASRIIAFNNLLTLIRSEKTPEEEEFMNKVFDLIEVITAFLAVIVASKELYETILNHKKSKEKEE